MFLFSKLRSGTRLFFAIDFGDVMNLKLNLLTPFDIWRMHLDLKQLIQIACRALGARLAMLAWLKDWRQQLLCSKTEVGRSIIVARIPLHQCSRLLLAEETREESPSGQGDDLHCEDNNDLNL